MDLITTPAYHTSNSYGTVAQADAYFASYNRLASSATWSSLSTSEKTYALVIAANVLNTFSFRGQPVTRQQKLAFPRFTNYQVVHELKVPLATFYDIEYTKLVDEEELAVTDNKFIDESTSANIFYNDIADKDLQLNQLIKVVRGDIEYLTIKDMDIDGAWIEVKEDIEAETDLTTTIYASDIFGFPDEIMWAQFETAYQVVDTRIFQSTVGADPDRPIASASISGAVSVRYREELYKSHSFENSSQLDLIHYLLGNWLAGVKGRMV